MSRHYIMRNNLDRSVERLCQLRRATGRPGKQEARDKEAPAP